MPEEQIAIGRWIVLAVAVIAALIIIAMSVVVIDAGHVGVHSLFGVVDREEMQPGLHFVNPLAGVYSMSIKTQEYTMSIMDDEGQKKGSDTISALTSEGLTIDLDITVLYALNENKANSVYKNIGLNYVDIIVRPQIRTVIRDVVARYTTKDIYSTQRQAIALEIYEELTPFLTDKGILLEDVLLRNIKLPHQLTNAIEEKLTAEQRIEQKAFQVLEEAEEANRKRIEAQGIADAQEIIDESLTESYLTWYWIEKLQEHESVIYVPIGESGLPLFRDVR